ncbi:hypothetical protein AAE478_009724 [Parahypoxylon ruwenzoriense]
MTKVQKADPDLPSRSDSFLRMLELEKRYKMQRIQGHASASIESPSTSSSSAQPNKPFKARRLSGHPPLSHQIQIMKAVRRSSALPSLSISIPLSPAEGPAVGTNGLVEEPQPKKEERTKTVTFSGPKDDDNGNGNDGDSSDQSSICQSPSWEQYGRKKKKKPKKRDAEKNKDEKSSNILKKKGNRLSKVPPQRVQGVEPLAATNRSQSAPELDLYPKPGQPDPVTANQTQPNTMTNPKVDGKQKSKGFLSSFRLQHGNVSAVQKIIDGQRAGSEGNQSPMLRPHPDGSGVDPSFINPRKPPSISSAVSNSTRSISSLDQLPPSARNSSGSSHGRSQSLLSSTLSKLRGPSYLYYRPTEAADNNHHQRPGSSQGAGIAPNWLNDQPPRRPLEKHADRPNDRQIAADEPPQRLPDFAFPPKPKRVTTQASPEVVSRSVQDRARSEELKERNRGYESPEPTSFRSRRTQMSRIRSPNRESATEKERRSRPDRVSRAPRQPVELSRNGDDHPLPQSRQPNRELERQYHASYQTNAYVQPQMEVRVESKHVREPAPPIRHDVRRFDNGEFDQQEVYHDKEEEDDRLSIDTHTSTIRPLSRRQGQTSPELNGRKHVTFPPSPSTIGRAVTSQGSDEQAEETVTGQPKPERQAGVEEIIRTENAPRPEKSSDYFSFVTQSYAPPSLELRPPMDGKFPSPRIDEVPEDAELDHLLRNLPIKVQVNKMIATAEIPGRTATSGANVANRAVRQQPPKDSPSVSSHYSDSDVPAFERLGVSPKAAKVLAGTETSSTSTSQSNTEPSRSTSERSSSSTCDDAPPTPDSSRPQSRKGQAINPPVNTSNRVARPRLNGDERVPRRTYRPPTVEPSAKNSSRSASREANVQDDSWSRTAMPIDLDNHPETASDDFNGLTASPRLIASPTPVVFVDDAKESLTEEELATRNPYRHAIPPRAQSALDFHSTGYLPDPKHQLLHPKKAKGGTPPASLPNSPPVELADGAPRKSALRMSRKNNSNSEDSSAVVSSGAAYLEEARKAAPIPPPVAASRALRPHYAHKNSSNSVRGTGAPENRSDPLAKMLVECCNCKFFHDMPSRVYECMAKPDSLVEDKLLGVSATITTMVKCPWCGHGMSSTCCSGYAAVVYLKEKLHGK